MGVERFQEMYRDELNRLLEGPFKTERLWNRMDELAAVIREPIRAESEFRLARFETAVATDWPDVRPNRRMIGPKRPAHAVKRFIQNRVRSVRAQLNGNQVGVVIQESN